MRRLLLAGVALAVALSVTAVAYSRLASMHGAYLVIHGLPEGYAAVYIEAVEPQGPVPFLLGAYRVPQSGTLVVMLPRERLQALAKTWHERRPGLGEFGAILHMVVVNPKTGRVKLHLLDSISIPVGKVLAGKPLVIEASVKRLGNMAARLTGLKMGQPSLWEIFFLKPAKSLESATIIETVKALRHMGGALEPQRDGSPPPRKVCVRVGGRTSGGLAFTGVCWSPILYVTPEDVARLYGNESDAIKRQYGLLYVQTPIAIVYNKYDLSGVILVSLSPQSRLQVYSFYPSFEAELASLVKTVKGDAPIPFPSPLLWRGSGATWRGHNYAIVDAAPVFPGESVTLYIYSRPFYIMYNVSVGGGTGLEEAVVEAEALVSDVMTKYISIGIVYIDSVSRKGALPGDVMAALLQAGGLVYATTIEPRCCGIPLQLLLVPLGGNCRSPGIPIPVGAFAAVIACKMLVGTSTAYTSREPRCAPFVTATANLQAWLTVEPSQDYYYGGISNEGRERDIGMGYDLNESLYVEFSRYYYDLGGCTARVPLGPYIESR